MKREIESAGGASTVFRASSVEGATDKEIIAAFQTARNAEFAVISSALEKLRARVQEQSHGKRLSPARLAVHETELDRLHNELQRVIANDFFQTKGRSAAVNTYERAKKSIRGLTEATSRRKAKHADKGGVLTVADYQGRRWVTRQNIHVDRIASAWLIKRFIDKHPRFYFAGEDATVENAIPFDMFGAEFTHHGDDCTFETMLKRFGLTEIKGLRELSEIVHDVDLKDDKFNRLEAAGVNTILNGLSESLQDDRKLLNEASVILDGLFVVLDKGESKNRSGAKKRTKKR